MAKLTTVDRAVQLRAAWRARGWPDDLLERAQGLQLRMSRLKRWATDDRWTVTEVRDALDRQARAPTGSLKVRSATLADNDALVDLYANSPSDQGESVVTVERGPYAFAQFALQDNSDVQIVEDGGKLLATLAHANTAMRAGGIETPVYIPLGWRVHNDVRGEGLGPLLQNNSYRRSSGNDVSMLYYRRRGSKKAQLAEMFWYPSQAASARSSHVRHAVRSDLEACVSLISGTHHRHFDIFPVYDERGLGRKLDADTREGRPSVYGWEDYYVFEDAGTVIACAGLWDRGRHMRERWLNKTTGGEHVVQSTALIDFGFADGSEVAMATLIEHLIGVTADRGRDQLMAPLQFLPQLAVQLEHRHPKKETRAWYWNNNSMLRGLGFKPIRPYTDLAYW